MHEATIAQSILNIVTDRLKSVGVDACALSVEIVLGEFRNVDPESLSFAFDSMKDFCPATSNCRLDINVVNASALCSENAHNYRPVAELAYRCPACDGGIAKMVHGEELDVVNLIIEVADEEKKHARIAG